MVGTLFRWIKEALARDVDAFVEFVARHKDAVWWLSPVVVGVRFLRFWPVAVVVAVGSVWWLRKPFGVDAGVQVVDRVIVGASVLLTLVPLVAGMLAVLALGQHLHRCSWWRDVWASPKAVFWSVIGVAGVVVGFCWYAYLEFWWKLFDLVINGRVSESSFADLALGMFGVSLLCAGQYWRTQRSVDVETRVSRERWSDFVRASCRRVYSERGGRPLDAAVVDRDFQRLLLAYERYGAAVHEFLGVADTTTRWWAYREEACWYEDWERDCALARGGAEREGRVAVLGERLEGVRARVASWRDNPDLVQSCLDDWRDCARDDEWGYGRSDSTRVVSALAGLLALIVRSCEEWPSLCLAACSPAFGEMAREHYLQLGCNRVAIDGERVLVSLPALIRMLSAPDLAERFENSCWRGVPEIGVLFGDLSVNSLLGRYLRVARDREGLLFTADCVVGDAVLLALAKGDARYLLSLVGCLFDWFAVRAPTDALVQCVCRQDDGVSYSWVPRSVLSGLRRAVAVLGGGCRLDRVVLSDVRSRYRRIEGFGMRSLQRGSGPQCGVDRFGLALLAYEAILAEMEAVGRALLWDEREGLLLLSSDGAFRHFGRALQGECGVIIGASSAVKERIFRALGLYRPVHGGNSVGSVYAAGPWASVVEPDVVGAILHENCVILGVLALGFLRSLRTQCGPGGGCGG